MPNPIENGIKSFQYYFYFFLFFLILCVSHLTSSSDIEYLLGRPLIFNYQPFPLLLDFKSYFLLVPGALVVFHGIITNILIQILRNPYYGISFVSPFAFISELKDNIQIVNEEGENQSIASTNKILIFLLYLCIFFIPQLVLGFYLWQYLRYQSLLMSILHFIFLVTDTVMVLVIAGSYFSKINFVLKMSTFFSRLISVINIITFLLYVVPFLIGTPIFFLTSIIKYLRQKQFIFWALLKHIWKYRFYFTLVLIFVFRILFTFCLIYFDFGFLTIGVKNTIGLPHIEINGSEVLISNNQSLGDRNFLYLDMNRLEISKCDFSKSDFRFANIDNTIFSECNFSNSDFDFAELNNVSFKRCDFESFRFSPQQLEGCKFLNCNFYESSIDLVLANRIVFDSSRFVKSNFIGDYIDHCSFKYCNFDEVQVEFCIMDNNDFSCATFENSQLRNNSMKLVNFNGANLCKSNFLMTDLFKSSFKGVDLRSAILYANDFSKTNFDLALWSGISRDENQKSLNKNTYFGSNFKLSHGTIFIDTGYVDKFFIGLKSIGSGFYPCNNDYEAFADSLFKSNEKTIDSIYNDLSLKYRNQETDSFEYYNNKEIIIEAIEAYKAGMNEVNFTTLKDLNNYYSEMKYINPFIGSEIILWKDSDKLFGKKRNDVFIKSPWFSDALKTRCISIDIFHQVLNDDANDN